MVIVHLSTNSRRIISPEKNETLEQLFKRFCQEFSYRESEYEFQSYPEDNRVPLDLNINANRVKEVSLVIKRVSRRNSDESCYAVIRDKSPVILENRKKVAASVPITYRVPSNENPGSERVSDDIKPKKPPKRNAPKAPLINDKMNDEINESKIPDFDIPPPPEFMPHEETTDKEPYYKSVQCETIENCSDLSRETSRSDSVTEASETCLSPREICHSSNNIDESDKEDINNDNDNDCDETTDLHVNLQPINIQSESDTESSVEDVYEDESLLGNQKSYEKLEVKSQIFVHKSDELQSNDKFSNKRITEPIEMVRNESKSEEWKHPDHVSLNESAHLNCPIAEMEETDMKSFNSSSNEHLSDSDDPIECNVVTSFENQIDEKEKIDINPTSIDQIDSKLNYEDSLSLGGNNKADSKIEENIDEAPKPKTRVKHQDKSTRSSRDSGEVLELSRSQSEIPTEAEGESRCENKDISHEDGHPTDFPITITSEPSNPKFYWELPKQSKTIQIMSRAYHTIDIPEPKVVQKIEQPKAPATAPKPLKEVKVTVQVSSSDPTGRPTFQKPPTKSFYFTAAPTDVTK